MKAAATPLRGTPDARLAPLSLLVLTALFCLAAAVPAVRAAEIALPAAPPAHRTVDPVEKWRIGGEEDDDILLGLIQTGTLGPDGNIYLVDRQLSQVLVIDPQGELVTTLGRQGEGPGEITRPHGLFVLDDGRVGVVQGFPSRVVLINPDGTPAGEIQIGGEASEGGFNFVRQLTAAQGKMVAQKGRGAFDTETQKSRTVTTLSVLDLDGAELVEIVRHEQENDLARRIFDERANFSEMDQWAAGPDGTIATVPERDAYVINLRDLEGGLRATFRREFPPRKRDQEDRDELTDGMIVMVNGRRQEIESKTLDHDPAIMGLNLAADGRLFVTNCYDRRKLLPEGIGASYDVIAPDGTFIEELDLRVPDFNPEQDRIEFLDGKRFLHLRGVESARDAMFAAFGDGEGEAGAGEAEPLEVVMYEIP